MKIITGTATRADFAGGTLDLYPLYLFMNGGLTVNCGLTLRSTVEIETGRNGKVKVVSRDLKEEAEYSNIEEMALEGPTAFIERAVKSYSPNGGITVKTRNTAPKGSGLGASSSLLMALSAALIMYKNEEIDITKMIDQGAAIEAAHLGIPTGKQDYYGAVLGGIHALHFDEKGCVPEKIIPSDKFRKELVDGLIVSFTGISHFSGANNWDMLKNVIDRVGNTYECLGKIKDIAYLVRDALKKEDPEELGHLISQEWENRKKLADGISNEFIDNAIKAADEAGAWGSKLCGAGGGGCMITLCPADKREKVESALKQKGIEIMDATIDFDGLTVE